MSLFLDLLDKKVINILKVLTLSFKTTPISKKIILMSFSTIILTIAIIISVLTSGKAFITILFAVLASLGMAVVCLEKQYHKIRELEKNTMNNKATAKKTMFLPNKKKMYELAGLNANQISKKILDVLFANDSIKVVKN